MSTSLPSIRDRVQGHVKARRRGAAAVAAALAVTIGSAAATSPAAQAARAATVDPAAAHAIAAVRTAAPAAAHHSAAGTFAANGAPVVGHLVHSPGRPAPAQPAPADDPNLDQTVDGDEPVVNDRHIIDSGHVDMGPKFVNGKWEFMLRDDAHKADASAQSVWRHMSNTVLHVNDSSKLTLPSNKTYSFTGSKPGQAVWVIPQTQNPRVVWAGWNTQDPDVMAQLGRGVTFSVDGVQGPGVMTVFLQNGDLGGAPEVLWDSRKKGHQTAFVDTNTHTHANWVFTKPGVYLVKMTATATLKNQKKVTDTELVRFAVGDSTSGQTAMSAAWKGSDAVKNPEQDTSSTSSQSQAPATSAPATAQDQGSAKEEKRAGQNSAIAAGPSKSIGQVKIPKADDQAQNAEIERTSQRDPMTMVLIIVIAVVALGLIILVVTMGVRGSRAKRDALDRGTAGRQGGRR